MSFDGVCIPTTVAFSSSVLLEVRGMPFGFAGEVLHGYPNNPAMCYISRMLHIDDDYRRAIYELSEPRAAFNRAYAALNRRAFIVGMTGALSDVDDAESAAALRQALDTAIAREAADLAALRAGE